MVYDDDPKHVQQQRHPAPLSRATENRAAGSRLAAVLMSSESNKNGHQQGQQKAATDDAGNATGSSTSGGNAKRRLRPMELKQQQRMQKEQRKRAKLSSSVPLPSSSTAALESAAGRSGADAAGAASSRDSRSGGAARAGAAARAGGELGGKEPLKRSASSPPSISCARGSSNEDGTTCSTRPDRRNVTPPKRHPLGLIDGIVEESRHPLAPSPAKDNGGDPVGAGLPGLCNSPGSRTGNSVVASESCAAAAGVGVGGADDAEQLVVNGGSEAGAASFQLHANPGRPSFGASTGGGGGGGGGASLFDMVMSGASSCSPQSSNGGGGGGNGGRSRLAVAATTGARAEGGKPVASSLSGMLGGMRGRQPAANSRDEEVCGVDPSGRGAGGVRQASTEDWMAINLEKLSNFRVPETRMGFPEGGREGLRRSATLPSRSSFSPRAEEQQSEARGATGGAAAGRAAGEPRWTFGCRHPLGRGQQQQRQQDAPVSDGGRLLSLHNPLSTSPPDLPLRTRVRFEMAPGVPVPRGIGSLPGHLESRALRAFAAGSLGMENRPEEDDDGGQGRLGLGRGGDAGGAEDSADEEEEEEEEQGWSSGVVAGGDRGGRRRARLAETFGGRRGGRGEGANDEEAAAAAAAAARKKEEEAMEKWRKATLYWEHPATPLPQEALAAQKAAQSRVAKSPAHATKAQDSGARPGGSAASGWTSFFWSRRRDWEQAFGSLYYGLISRNRGGGDGARGGAAAAAAAAAEGKGEEGEGFYLQCPLYTVVWRLVRERGGAEDGCSRLVPAAVMTRSTRRLRKRLTAAGIEFGMPLDPAGDQRDAQADEDVLEEWKAMDATGNARPGAVYANEEDRNRPQLSLLTFRGHMAVHGLFDFLLEACGHSMGVAGGGGLAASGGRGGARMGSGGDVPLLLSREPFLNASLKALKVRQKGPMHRSRATVSAGQDSAVQVLELVGHVLPSALADLSLAMASACTAGGNLDYNSNDDDDYDDHDGGSDGGGRRMAETAAATARGAAGAVSKPATAAGVSSRRRPPPPEAQTTAGVSAKDTGGKNDVLGDDDSQTAVAAAAAAAGPGPGTALFRAVGAVDPDTAHLNAGFETLLEEGRGTTFLAEERQRQVQDGGDGSGGGVEEEAGRRRRGGGDSSYCKETRARVLLTTGGRQRRQQQQRVVFDVCSIDPAGMTAYVS